MKSVGVFVIGCLSVNANSKSSSFQCIGGSQALDTNSMKQAAVQRFPLNDAEHRTCLMRNVCFVNGTLTYFITPHDRSSVPRDFLPEGFDGKMFHTGHLRAFTISMKTQEGYIPESYHWHHSKLAFFDANSWSFNWGHYMNDNVMTAFVAAKIFNLPFVGTQQVIETNCRLFSTLEPGFADKLIDYNHSMGSYRQGCLDKFNNLWNLFFDNPPIYLDDMQQSATCFRRMIVGQGSTFGLKSVDLSRAIIRREFRDFVLSRNFPEPMPPQENMILVGLRVQGSAGGAIIGDLCGLVKNALASLGTRGSPYHVVCIHPSDLSMKEEITWAQRAKVIITVHGTISYLSLFSREGTQQISLASPKELKENQMLLWTTHFQTHYLTWDRMHLLSNVLGHTLSMSEGFFNDID